MQYELLISNYNLFDADLSGLIFSIIIFVYALNVLTYCSETIKILPIEFQNMKEDELNVAMLEYSDNKLPSYSKYSRWLLTLLGTSFSISELQYALISITILKGEYNGIDFYLDYLITSVSIYLILFIIWYYKSKRNEKDLKKKYNANNVYCALVITNSTKDNNCIFVKNIYKEIDILYNLNLASIIVVTFAILLKAVCYLAFEDIVNLVPYIYFVK